MIDFSNWFRGTRCVVSGCCLISLLVGVAPAEGQDASGWQAIELYRLGGVDAPPEEEFTNQLLSLSLGPNDQLFVLDLSSSRIQVFSAANGEYVRTIARAGRGPGEILDATGLGWDRDDQLWVKEPFARRYSVFDSTGTFIRTVPSPWSPVPSRTGRVDFDEEGRLVETAIEDSGPFLRVLDPTSGELIDEYSVLPASQRHPALPSSIVGVPDNVVQAVRRFQPRVIWDWLPDGRVWFAHQDDYRLFASETRWRLWKELRGPGSSRTGKRGWSIRPDAT